MNRNYLVMFKLSVTPDVKHGLGRDRLDQIVREQMTYFLERVPLTNHGSIQFETQTWDVKVQATVLRPPSA